MASHPATSRRKHTPASSAHVDIWTGTSDDGDSGTPSKRPGSHGADYGPTFWQDFPNMLLLVVLYMMQGVPLGLTMGSMPFMLSSAASYTQIGIFSIAAYPYSFKLLWSPIVDSYYLPKFGRRKSWIVPLQLVCAVTMISFAPWAEAKLQLADVKSITGLFFFLVLLAATQDIAVDGWALTLLSRKHVGYASTCQTVGMNIGYFTSFTVFLAFNDPNFCNTYFRSAENKQAEGFLSLAGYMRFWGVMYLLVTLAVWLFKREKFHAHPRLKASRSDNSIPEVLAMKRSVEVDDEVGIGEAYAQLWGVVKLPAVLQLSLVLVTCRLAMLPAESAAPFQLLAKGVSKEALAGIVLVEFPCELLSALLAGRWSSQASPLRPWQIGYVLRLAAAAAVTALVYYFPPSASALSDHPASFFALAAIGLTTSFSSTLMFTSMGNFYNRISDPSMGGAYLTLLNTIANMGVILPKFACFALMDYLTVNSCRSVDDVKVRLDFECPTTLQSKGTESKCSANGGTCVSVHDGFYIVSYSAIVVGVVLMFAFRNLLPKLSALPTESWRDKTRSM